jgi:SAM-dependent methyltransferase
MRSRNRLASDLASARVGWRSRTETRRFSWPGRAPIRARADCGSSSTGVFGAIFAFDARRAFSEVLRVLKPDGRAFVSAWVPAGAIGAMIATIVPAVSRAMGSEIPRFPWSDPDAVSAMGSTLGATVRFHHGGDIAFTASSPEHYLELQEREHPLTRLSRAVLEQAGTYPAVRRQALAALRDGNEDPHAFRATSPYRIIEIRHR